MITVKFLNSRGHTKDVIRPECVVKFRHTAEHRAWRWSLHKRTAYLVEDMKILSVYKNGKLVL